LVKNTLNNVNVVANKIKILFLIDAIETDRAGTEGQIIKLIRNMNTEDFECHLGIFKDSEWINQNKNRFNIFLVGTASLRKFDFFKGIVRLYTYLRDNRIEIVNAYFPTSITIGVLISKIAGVKYIVSSRRDMGFWRTIFITEVLKISNKFVTKFLVNSNVVKSNVVFNEYLDSNRIDVIYNGLELPIINENMKSKLRTQLNIEINDYVVGTVANLNREVKRIDVFIQSAKCILDINPKVKFLIVGDGHLRGKHNELAKQLNIDHMVVFLGSVSNPQDYESIFDIAINSSDSEGFSNAVLEYMALGIPTVATDVGGNSEIICNLENGILVPPGNPQKMADAVLILLNNRILRESISFNAKKHARKFSLSLMVSKHENYFKNIISN
jgi:L-malate glycosyltransferase